MIELDLVPWLVQETSPNQKVADLYAAVSGRINYGSVEEFVLDENNKEIRTPYPYIYIEGPMHFDDNRINEGSSSRTYTGIRVWVCGNNMTETSTILGLVHKALGSLQNIQIGNTWVQAFYCENKWVDNRISQRGKQEKDSEASEDPLASGHIDYCVLASDTLPP